MLDLQAGGAGQVDALGTPVQHRLRADVDEDPGHGVAAQLAADAVGASEQEHVVPGRRQVAGSGEPGDAASDHDHATRSGSPVKR